MPVTDPSKQLAEKMEEEVRPLVHRDKMFHTRDEEPGYNCCGCATYDLILDHAIALVLGISREDYTKQREAKEAEE